MSIKLSYVEDFKTKNAVLCIITTYYSRIRNLPLKPFMWATAIRSIVSLSGFLAKALHVGTMSDSSVIYAVILFLLRLSISQWFSRLQTNTNHSKNTLQNYQNSILPGESLFILDIVLVHLSLIWNYNFFNTQKFLNLWM